MCSRHSSLLAYQNLLYPWQYRNEYIIIIFCLGGKDPEGYVQKKELKTKAGVRIIAGKNTVTKEHTIIIIIIIITII